MKQTQDQSTTATATAPTPEQLMHSLLETAFAIRGRLEEALQSVGLSGAKYELLAQLAERGEPTLLSQLALGQKCAASNITQLMDRLEAEGLVRRVDDAADRRSKRAMLTPLGEERHAAGAIQVERIQSEFASSLSDADREALARGLSASLPK